MPVWPTSFAGTPATVECAGTGFSTTDPAAIFERHADLDIAEDLGAGADQHAVADLGMAVAGLLAGAAERHVLQDRDIVLDHRRLADDEAGGVVEEDAAAHRHRRIDVGLEDLRRAALQVEREVAPPRVPQPVRQAVGLDGVEALEVEQRLDVALAGRIAVVDRGDVATDDLAEFLIGGQRIVEGAADDVGAHDVESRRWATRFTTASSRRR